MRFLIASAAAALPGRPERDRFASIILDRRNTESPSEVHRIAARAIERVEREKARAARFG